MLRRGGATDGSVCEVLPGMLAGLLGFLQTWIIYVVATCIIPGLYLGSIRGLDHLQTYEITHVVSVLNGRATADLSAFSVHYVDLEDVPESNLLAVIPKALMFMLAALQQPNPGRVFVHCLAGVSRSVSVVCAYIMKTQNFSALQAFEKVRSVRVQANPNSGFMEQLLLFEKMECSLDFVGGVGTSQHPVYREFFKHSHTGKTIPKASSFHSFDLLSFVFARAGGLSGECKRVGAGSWRCRCLSCQGCFSSSPGTGCLAAPPHSHAPALPDGLVVPAGLPLPRIN